MNAKKFFKAFEFVVALAPFALIPYGCWLIYQPAAYIVLGIMIFVDLKATK